MFLEILLLIAGIALIVGGGNYVTNGAVAVAERFNLSPMLIGLTVVALGSSTPDLAVSLMSTVHGKSALAVGNILGAVTFDMLLVIGLMAVIKPIDLSSGVRRVDLPVMMIGALILMICGISHYIDHDGTDAITRVEAILMLLVFLAFMVYTVHNSRTHDRPSTAPAPKKTRPMKMWVAAVCIIGGLAALVIGGDITVDAASKIALRAGMSEALIGITIVGIGSSLPDLATSLIAALKGQNSLALGNIVGSSVMDILMVIGVCGTVRPLGLAGISPVDFIVLAAAAVMLTVFGLAGKRISRTEGLVLLLGYISYITYLVLART